jgi:hypothetical protein
MYRFSALGLSSVHIIPMSTLLVVLERQEISLVIDSAVLITRYGSLLLGGLTGNVLLGLSAFSATGVLVYGVMSILILRYAGVRLGTGLQVWDLCCAVCTCIRSACRTRSERRYVCHPGGSRSLCLRDFLQCAHHERSGCQEAGYWGDRSLVKKGGRM